MCILLYVKLMWCSGITYIYGQLEEGAWYMCILLYIDLWSIGGGPWYMCILLYVKLIQCSGIT